MKIGVRIPCYRKWCRAPEVRAIATTAEDLGFDSLWVQDHVVAPLGPPDAIAVQGVSDYLASSPAGAQAKGVTTLFEYYAGDDWWLDPYVTWAYLAAITSRVVLASDVMVIPYRNPVVQAKMLGTLDVLSEGRMLLGTGTGHVAAESAALGIDFAARGRMHDEYLRVIKAVLSSEEASFDGEFFRFGPLRTLIRPVQQPHPPIYVGGNAPRSIRRAAELGDGWLPSDPDPEGLARGIDRLHTACDKAGRAEPPKIALSLPSRFRLPVPGYRSARNPDTSPDEVVAELRRYEALGVDHVSLGFRMPNATVYLQQIQSFAQEVLPAFR